jgi:two-component system, cell cycle sensor histidine kinase and response regulator CckA
MDVNILLAYSHPHKNANLKGSLAHLNLEKTIPYRKISCRLQARTPGFGAGFVWECRQIMKNSPVGTKLGIAFGLLLALLIGLGWLGLSRMSRTKADLNQLGCDISKLELAQRARDFADLNIKLVTQILILDRKEDVDTFEAKRIANRIQTAAAMAALKPKIDSEAETALLNNIDLARIPARVSVDRIFVLLNQGNKEDARQLMVNVTFPLLEKYEGAWAAFVQFQKDRMEQVEKQSEATSVQTQRIGGALISLAIALAIVIAVFATQRIVRDDRLREGTKDEIRILNEHLESNMAKRTADLAHAVQKLESEIAVRRKSEEDLKSSEADLATAQRIAHLGSFQETLGNLDTLESNPIRMSDEVFRILGYEPGQIEPTRANVMRAIHPEDRDGVRRAARRAILNREPYNHEYRIVLPDGSERVVHTQWKVLCDQATGEPARLIGTIQDITGRKKAEERFYKAFNANPEPISISTISESRYTDVNESFLRVTGYSREEVIGRTSEELGFWGEPQDRERFIDLLRKQGSVRELEIKFRTKSGEVRTAADSAEIIDVAGQECVIAIFRDITEQNSLERQLRQTQKMEAIGQLSGGIAHDFNNLLSVIIGYSEAIEERLSADDSLLKMCQQIRKAGQSAASLTRQLLAFSRQQVLEAKFLDVNEIVRNMEKMLRRLIGEDIEFSTGLEPALAHIKADQGQIEQVILNLAVNARDAMPHGGRIRIETTNVELDAEYARLHPHQEAGSYVLLTFADTGTGMDVETQAHIFEPFFTTKEIGKGTGLGLSTVYGVIRQSGGHIWVSSELGQGTTFKIYMPQAQPSDRGKKPSATAASAHHSAETILLVEDSQPVRELTLSMLTESGYNVLPADHPQKAIEVAESYKGPIHLLLTDMVMPGMNGQTLAEKLALIRPDLKVLYTSGYTGFSHSALLDADLVFLPKPFTKHSLLSKLRQVLASDAEFAPS